VLQVEASLMQGPVQLAIPGHPEQPCFNPNNAVAAPSPLWAKVFGGGGGSPLYRFCIQIVTGKNPPNILVVNTPKL